MQNAPDQKSSGQLESATPPTSAPQIDPLVLERLITEKRARQSLPLALGAGAIGSIVAAFVWAGITVGTGYQIGWIAVGVGFLVGLAVRFAGKGVDPLFGYIGAVFALLGCVVGNILSVVGFVAKENAEPFFELLGRVDLTIAADMLTATFSPIDLLFYGIAVYQGYHFSFARINVEELSPPSGAN